MTARQTEAERRAATILRLDHAVAYVRDYVLRAEDPTGCGVILTQLIELRRRFERATELPENSEAVKKAARETQAALDASKLKG